MRTRFGLVFVAGVLAAWLLIAAAAMAASPKDYADTALNIVPPGEYGSISPPPEADDQARMYDDLTPLFEAVRKDDLTTYFKSEALGIGTDGPTTVESIPRPGVEVVRDRFNVPHVTAPTHDDGVWTAGWLLAEDRGLLLEIGRYASRVAAIDAPGLSAVGLLRSAASFQPSPQTEAEIAKQTDVLLRQGKEGEAVLHDIDVFIEGINAYLAAHNPAAQPWTRVDVYALNALKGQFVGEGGGGEARRSQFLGGLEERLGAKRGMKAFNDLRQFKNPELPATIDGRFPYEHIPSNAKGSAVLDPGSFTPSPSVPSPRAAWRSSDEPSHASNTLMITKDRSKTDRPLMVGGPQIGFNYPGFVYEIDMNAGDLVWRGITSAPFPGYLLIGRGEDFANTLTSAGSDIIDQYAEKLCGGSDTMYKYKGECWPMERFDAGTLNGQPVSFMRTVHGPVVGYATVDGKKIAISRKRSSYGRDVVDQLFFRRLSTGKVDDPKSFFNAASKTPQTFNSFYIDHKHIAMFTSGRLPIRPDKVDPGLPAWGTGKYEWQGFVGKAGHMQGTDPRDGTMVNWNQGAAKGFAAADNDWGKNGSIVRSNLLSRELRRLADGNGEWSLASVTAAMNAAATQDVRAIFTTPLLRRLLEGSKAPNAQAAQMLDILIGWRARGGSRLDRNLDGKIDDPGAAIMDKAWPLVANAAMKPVLGPQLDELDTLFERWEAPPEGQEAGWYQYMDRDLRDLLGMEIKAPLKLDYCGKGKLKACRDAIWDALAEAGAELTAEQGTSDPTAWRADATAERIAFSPIPMTTMRYTNRPSGIQQVISFKGHR